MFCINCGVRLSDTEKICPLCGTEVYHPSFSSAPVHPLYPDGRRPQTQANSKAFNILFIAAVSLALLLCFLTDLLRDGRLTWFGFVAGGLILGYIVLALPLWFKRPSPAVFVPCDFAACAVYLLYIALATGSDWFLSFAFPAIGSLCLIISAFAILLYYLKKGRLYIWGGTLIALGLYTLLLEFLLDLAFGLGFRGWSLYSLAVLAFTGGALLYLAINSAARETLERKLLF